MAQLLFNRGDDAMLMAAVSRDGDVTVTDYPLKTFSAHDARWSRFNCDQSHAHVLLTIGEHNQLPDRLAKRGRCAEGPCVKTMLDDR